MPAAYQARIEKCRTRVTKLVFPNTTNHHQTLFGGTAMQWMDEVAFITATRFTRQKMVTVSMDRIDFKTPIPAGSMVELVGEISNVGNTSLTGSVNVYKEDMYEGGRELAMSGILTFVAVDEHTRPVSLSVHQASNYAD